MLERIAAALDRVEQDHDVRILLAIESGSRAWGFRPAIAIGRAIDLLSFAVALSVRARPPRIRLRARRCNPRSSPDLPGSIMHAGGDATIGPLIDEHQRMNCHRL